MTQQTLPTAAPFSKIGEMIGELYGAYIRADATRTFVSDTNAQAIFNSPAGGALTLPVGTFQFDALIGIDTLSASSGNGKWGLLGAGTATLTQVLQLISGIDGALDTTAAVGGTPTVTSLVGSTDSVTASTSTVLTLRITGVFTVTVAGSIIPSFTQTNASAAVVKVGSFFSVRQLGAVGATSVGSWA